jgi:uncharacterized membrane protein YjjP (DUF1212 family)
MTTNNELSHQELAEILRATIRVGIMMLQSGAASARAGQVMEHVAQGLGVEQIEAYVTPTVIIATVYSGREHRTQIVKPTGLGVDMNRIGALVHLSRNMPEHATPSQIVDRLDAIQNAPPEYPRYLVIAAVGLACGAFAGILGGGLAEISAATIAAAIAQAVRMRMLAARLNPIAIAVVCSALGTGISLFLVRALAAPTPRTGLVASVLLLVPGVPLVTSILDATRFDLVSALSRGLYATLILIGIGIGMLIVLAWSGLSIL